MALEKDDVFYNRVGGDRIASRQIDELIGIARGLVADNTINHSEVEFLRDWLSSNLHISDQPVIRTLYQRVASMLADGVIDDDEKMELLDTLNAFSNRDAGTGEMLKSTSLPLDAPPPVLRFRGIRYCFTGTFSFGQRKACEAAVTVLGATTGALTQKTNVLVVGVYATESWKHSSFGNKIIMACEWRERGIPISIVSEPHWTTSLTATSDA
ncbi:BRCT domain-containing protein [Nitrobacter sp.]|uniref:BRCT domain-containing protein n=1 Tax=Nitrobacter sp. TaxID=29420 RepID=UPI003F6531A0